LKFIGFFEHDLKDTDAVVEKFRQMTAEREKGTQKYPKLLYGSYYIGGESKGFGIYETDDMETITNLTIHYIPVLRCKFLPIHESSKWLELYLQSKK
jgi:hypothetical protein